MKKTFLLLSLLIAGSVNSQTALTLNRINEIWAPGQVPRGLNNSNTWYTLFNRANAGVTYGFIPYNNSGTFSDSWLSQDATNIYLAASKSFSSLNEYSKLFLNSNAVTLRFNNGSVSSTLSLNASLARLAWNGGGGNENFMEIVSDSTLLYHSKKIQVNADTIKFTKGTANKILYLDELKRLKPVTVGSGLSFTTGTLTATGGGTVTSVAALTLGTSGTDLSSSVANSTTTPVITLNVPTASASNRGALSSTDWSTFNGKQSTITFGTGVQTSLGVNIGSAGAPVLFNGALGTPSSGVLTNCTGTASGLTAGNVTTNANLTGDVTSSGNATTLATVNSNVGSFTDATLTVNAKGLITAAASGSTKLVAANNLSDVTASTARTNLGLVIGTDVAAIGDVYFPWYCIAATLSPADATTYYTGGGSNAPTTTATNVDFNIGYKCTVIGAVVSVWGNTTAGTAELTTLQLRNVTQASSSSMGTFATNLGSATVSDNATFTGLNIAVAASDFIAIQLDTPTWVTNPVAVRYYVTLMIKRAL